MRNCDQNQGVAIIGGGIIGLFAGYLLLEKGYQVTIFEKESAVGGNLSSLKIGDDVYVDRLYHHIFPQNRVLLSFISELGLADELVWRKNQTGIVINDKPLPLNSFSDLMKSYDLSLTGKYKYMIFLLRSLYVRNWKKFDRISVHQLIENNCGAEIWKKVFHPVLKGKFHDSASSISAAWFYKKLQQRAKCRTIGSGERLGAFKKSSKVLVDRLSGKIRENGGTILTGSRVERLKIKDQCFYGLIVNGRNYDFGRLIITIPIPEIINLFSSELTNIYDTVTSLKSIEYAHSLCTLVRLKKKLSGFYWLFVRDEQSPFFLIVEHTNLIKSETCNDEHVVYLARYVTSCEELYSKSDKEIFDNDFCHLQEIFSHISNKDIIDYSVTRVPYAQPIFKTNFLNIMPASKSSINGIYIINKSQLFLLDRTVNDSLILAKQCMNEWF